MRRVAWRIWGLALALLLVAGASGVALAAPLDPSGDIDAGFRGGITTANFDTVYSFTGARAAAIQPATGKTVLAGESVDDGNHHWGMVRLNLDGTQDRTFGMGGEVKLQIGSWDIINDIAIQGDGKIVAVGFSRMGNDDMSIGRFMPDGPLDTSFANGGFLTVNFNRGSDPTDRALGVAIQDDGKIVVSGFSRNTGVTGDDFALVRLNSNGSFDTSFGTGGMVTTPIGSGTGKDQAWDVVIVGSGAGRKILVGGAGRNQGQLMDRGELARYNNDGTLDTTFDGDGTALFNPPNNDGSCYPSTTLCGGEGIRGLALQNDGKIIATGSYGTYEMFPSTQGTMKTSMFTARFTAGGVLDASFNAADTPGFVVTRVARGYYTDIGLGVSVQSDGKIVSFGFTDQSEDFPAYVPAGYNFYYNQNFLFVRLNADGTRDSSFGPSPAGTFFQPGTVVPPGVVVLDLNDNVGTGKTYDMGYAVVVQGDGKIIGAGSRTYADTTVHDTYIGAARLLSNGQVDYGFGIDKNGNGTPDGYFYTQMLGGSIDVANGMARQSDGKVVVAGYTNIGSSQTRFGLARFNTNGTLDTTFGGDGLVVAGAPGMATNTAYGVAIDGDGRIVATGESAAGGTPQLTTMRFLPNGALDTSFSSDGIATNSFGTNANAAYALAIQPNGKIVVGGSVSNSAGNWDWLVLRYNADGTLDSGFDTDGAVWRGVGSGQNYDEIRAIVVQPDGKIVVGGFSNSDSSSRFALARLNADGSADGSFNGGAAVLTRLSAGNLLYAGDQIRGLALMSDGRIVAGGKALNSSGYNSFALARYLPNGALDISFSGDGLQTHSVSADSMDEIMGIALQHDEKIVAFGNTLAVGVGLADIKVARFNWDDGSLDATYASNGYVVTNISGYDRPVGGAVAPTGAVDAGRAVLGANPGSANFAAMRYLGDPVPGMPGMLDLAPASDSGRSNSDNITNDNTPTFTGSCTTGETVVLKVDGANTTPLSRALCRDGSYSVTAAIAVGDGAHNFNVYARNGYGDSSSTIPLSVVIDTVAAAPNIIAPAAGSTVNPEPTISGDGAETTADIAVTHSGGAICSSQASAAGLWSCSSTLWPGTYTISVRQTDIAGNLSPPATRTFSIKAPTTTALSISTAPTVYGQPATFTATVTSNYGTPNGSVTFTIDGQTTSVALSGGKATLTRSNLSVGDHSIGADYGGATLFFPSSAAPLAHTVIKADTVVALASSANPSVFGQGVSLTATVTAMAPGAGLPTGTVTFKDGATVLGTGTLNGAGVAAFSTSGLAVGGHAITVSYAGDGNFNPSDSPNFSQTVNKASTSTILTAAPNPSVFGQTAIFTATVTAAAPGAGLPAGTVTFKDGATVLGTGTLNGAGVATFSTAALTVGAHSITASYGGDGNFNAGSSPGYSQTVNKASTSAALSAAPSPSVYGQTVVFTATIAVVTPGVGLPTGMVAFKDGATVLGTATLDPSGVATFATDSLAARSYIITASYAGDPNFATSNSPGVSQLVDKTDTSTALGVAPSPSVFGQTVVLTATVTTVAPGAGAPVGVVAFKDGATVLGTGTLNGAGVATFSAAGLTAGAHSITASYGGNSNFSSSASAAHGQPVEQAVTSTNLASSASRSVYGQTVMLTATVTAVAPGSGVPAGVVTFKDGATVLGAGTLNSAGVATFTSDTFSVGAHTISASYGGNSNFLSSDSQAVDQPVGKAEVGVALASSVNPSVFGQMLTFTATVTAVAPGAGVPSGSVTFKDGTTVLGVRALNSSGVANLSTAALAVGSHSVSVEYAGDGNFNAAGSPAVDQSVGKATTAVDLASAPALTVFGQTLTFTATVTVVAPAAGLPTGEVTFKDGATVLGTATLNGTGVATLTFAGLSAGTHPISASYDGDANFKPSVSASGSQTVDKAATTVDLTSAPKPSVFGQTLTFTATVAAVAPGKGLPVGIVTFKDGATVLGTATLDDTGVAIFSAAALDVGTYTVTASYDGDANFKPSVSASGSQTVDKAATTVDLTSAPKPSVFGQTLTFTATVTAVAPSVGRPSGAVTFKDGTTVLGTASLNGTGVATFSTAALDVGAYAVTASYDGDASFKPGVSAVDSQTVGKADTAIALTSAPKPSVFGQTITFTATVTVVAPGVGMPTGEVTFKEGATVLGTGTLNGVGVASFSTTSLSGGTHTLTASYGGDASFAPSVSDGQDQPVERATSSTGLALSPTPSVFGQTVTFTATVTAAPGTPTGTVTFKDGVTVLGTGPLNGAGVVSISTSSLGAGAHSISASYSGDGNFAASASSSLDHLVDQTHTSIGLGIAPAASAFGQTVTFTATVTAIAPGGGVPGGAVTFKDGAAILGTGTLNGSGVAIFTTDTLTVGAHSITAAYAGDDNFQASGSATVDQSVAEASSTTTLSAPSAAVFGESITLSATVTAVAPGGGVPGGTVTFKDGATVLGTGALNGAGVATFTTDTLTVGAHTISAGYSGSANYAGSGSPAASLTIGRADSAVALVSAPNPSMFGQTVIFTATVRAVAPGVGIPSGAVTFKDGAAILGTGTLDGAGVVRFSTAGLTPGAHAITASYAGDAGFNASSSAALNHTVNRSTTTTSLAVPVPSVFGQGVTFTATVASAAGRPSGAVTFKDGATILGTSMLDGDGEATFTTTRLEVGVHSVSASYAGDANFDASTSPAVTHSVAKAATAVTLVSGTDPALLSAPLIFTATVTVVAPGAGLPGSMVTFKDGATVLGTGVLDGAGRASFATAALALGAHTITAEYAGDGRFGGSASVPLAQSVVPSADLSVEMRVERGSQDGAPTLIYTVSVTNNGPSEALDTVLIIKLPPVGASALPSNCVAVGDAIECAISTLAVGQTYTQTFELNLPADLSDDGSLGGSATVESSTGDDTPANNSTGKVVPARLNRVFLPMVAAAPAVQAPDLVVSSVVVTPDAAEVVIKNQGNVAVTEAFWVDLYVAPVPPPTGPNQPWSDGLSRQGAVWGVVGVRLAPGAELRLTLGGAYFKPEYSQLGLLDVGTVVYVQADSMNSATGYGAVREADELGAGAYNNIASTRVVAGAPTSVPAAAPLPSGQPAALPER